MTYYVHKSPLNTALPDQQRFLSIKGLCRTWGRQELGCLNSRSGFPRVTFSSICLVAMRLFENLLAWSFNFFSSSFSDQGLNWEKKQKERNGLYGICVRKQMWIFPPAHICSLSSKFPNVFTGGSLGIEGHPCNEPWDSGCRGRKSLDYIASSRPASAR